MNSIKDRVVMSRDAVAAQLGALGVQQGGVLLVHNSFRAVGPIEDGPAGLIDALRGAIGPNGTLVMPSWFGEEDAIFDPATSAASADLGVVADAFWRMPGVLRSDHFNAFAAIGPHAQEVVGDPLPLPPHIPESAVGRVHDLGGQVLLLGVGHDANTTLHLAEILAGVPYRVAMHGTIMHEGLVTRVEYDENDHCCRGFALADEWLRAEGLQAEGLVGHGLARLARSRDIVRLARAHLANDPLLFLHPREAGCAACDEARDSVPAA